MSNLLLDKHKKSLFSTENRVQILVILAFFYSLLFFKEETRHGYTKL